MSRYDHDKAVPLQVILTPSSSAPSTHISIVPHTLALRTRSSGHKIVTKVCPSGASLYEPLRPRQPRSTPTRLPWCLRPELTPSDGVRLGQASASMRLFISRVMTRASVHIDIAGTCGCHPACRPIGLCGAPSYVWVVATEHYSSGSKATPESDLTKVILNPDA